MISSSPRFVIPLLHLLLAYSCYFVVGFNFLLAKTLTRFKRLLNSFLQVFDLQCFSPNGTSVKILLRHFHLSLISSSVETC